MFMPKTHFEQVPMEIVRKIVEEQIRQETAAQQDKGTEKKTLNESLLGKQEHSICMYRTFVPVEVEEQS